MYHSTVISILISIISHEHEILKIFGNRATLGVTKYQRDQKDQKVLLKFKRNYNEKNQKLNQTLCALVI